MDNERIETIRAKVEPKATDELLEIWRQDDREAYSDEAFEAIRRLLAARGQPLPATGPSHQTDNNIISLDLSK